MKNNLSNILLYIFLLNSINIFSLGSDIKEIEPIESIHSDENSSVFVNDNSKSVSESSFEEIYKSLDKIELVYIQLENQLNLLLSKLNLIVVQSQCFWIDL